jgi:hypothetical protein
LLRDHAGGSMPHGTDARVHERGSDGCL